MRKDNIHYLDLFSGIGGFREGLTRAGGFACAGHCEIDKFAERATARCLIRRESGFAATSEKPIQKRSPPLTCSAPIPLPALFIAGNLGGFSDARGTLFFEIARLAAARKPAYLLLENVSNLLSHDGGRTFAAILHALDGLGYGVEWQVLNSKDFGVPQSRKRLYLIGYLDERCRGKIFPFPETAGTPLVQVRSGAQGERVYSPEGVSCTLTSGAGGFGGNTGLYAQGLPIRSDTKAGYQTAYPGDSVRLSYPTTDKKRGRVGTQIAHTLTTSADQGVLCCVDLNESPELTDYARCLTAKQNGGIHNHKREASGVWDGVRIRRLTPRECLRLQGWTDDRIDLVLPIQSDAQLYKQAGNGVTVNVVEPSGNDWPPATGR